MGMWKEFRDFSVKGNMVDLAVGLAIGSAFTGVVQSLVRDLITPWLGWLLGDVNLENLFVVLRKGSPRGPYDTIAEAQAAGAVTWNLGNFINVSITFVFVAVVLFFVVKLVNRLRNAPAQAKMTKDQELLTEIRDLLKAKE
ncbi:MAG: large conductance mechanosensitive channel protein MscL [Planctomycetota bacterium]